MKYEQIKDGEGLTIKNKVVFRLACCDCGLVHDVAIVAPKERAKAAIGLAMKRNNRATAGRRRKSQMSAGRDRKARTKERLKQRERALLKRDAVKTARLERRALERQKRASLKMKNLDQ